MIQNIENNIYSTLNRKSGKRIKMMVRIARVVRQRMGVIKSTSQRVPHEKHTTQPDTHNLLDVFISNTNQGHFFCDPLAKW